LGAKTLGGLHDKANRSSAIHLVSAWVADIRLVLGQLKPPDTISQSIGGRGVSSV
jgi:hypothetical protein